MHAQAVPRDARPKAVLLIAAQSYDTDRTLPEFAQRHLVDRFRIVTVAGAMKSPEHRFTPLEEISDAALLIVSVWRRAPPQDQLAAIRRYVTSGRPIVGICTSTHAFALRPGAQPAAGSATWPEWEATVFGSNYAGHHPIRFTTTVTAPVADHPLLAGVTLPFQSRMELNRVRPLHPRAQPLLVGTIEGQPAEPVAWTFVRDDGGRSFFTPLGHPDDFSQPAFQQLLRNGILWAASRGP